MDYLDSIPGFPQGDRRRELTHYEYSVWIDDSIGTMYKESLHGGLSNVPGMSSEQLARG